MADKRAQHHGNNSAALQCLRGCISQENRHEVEDHVAGCIHNYIGTVFCIKSRYFREYRQEALDQTCCRDSRNQRSEDLGNLLKNQVSKALLLCGNLHIAARGSRSHAVSQNLYCRIVNLFYLRAADYLELSAGNHYGNNAFQMLYHILLCLAFILQDETQTCKTVRNLFYVCFSAHIIDNVLGNFVVIHNLSLLLFPAAEEASASSTAGISLHAVSTPGRDAL